jgi:hypothetical protein
VSLDQELRNRSGIAHTLERFAALTAAQAEPERAARLFGAAEVLREATNSPLSPADRAEYYDDVVASVRSALSEAVFLAAWTEGWSMPVEQVIAEALREPLSLRCRS